MSKYTGNVKGLKNQTHHHIWRYVVDNSKIYHMWCINQAFESHCGAFIRTGYIYMTRVFVVLFALQHYIWDKTRLFGIKRHMWWSELIKNWRNCSFSLILRPLWWRVGAEL